MKKIMLLGFGAMAREVAANLPEGVELGWVVARVHHHADIREQVSRQTQIIEHPSQCDSRPDLVLECASQKAVAEYADFVLAQNWALALISTGALADEALYRRLYHRLQSGTGRLHILSGAVAGMDGLLSAREGGLESVTYISRKGLSSWKGTPAESMIDLNTVSETQIFFEGSAREAARLFPANANVAATIALMGMGMEATRVQLCVDPQTKQNSHSIQVRGRFGEFSIQLMGNPLESNPKTSMLAALSAVQACRRLVSGDLGV